MMLIPNVITNLLIFFTVSYYTYGFSTRSLPVGFEFKVLIRDVKLLNKRGYNAIVYRPTIVCAWLFYCFIFFFFFTFIFTCSMYWADKKNSTRIIDKCTHCKLVALKVLLFLFYHPVLSYDGKIEKDF